MQVLKVMLLGLFVTISLQKINQDNYKWGDYGEPFSEQRYTHKSFHISLLKWKSFGQSDLPKSPQSLDIYSVLVL